jgi:hypothetical protein
METAGAVEVIAVDAGNAASEAQPSAGDHGVASSTDSPMLDSQGIPHSNQITNRFGVEIMRIQWMIS